MRWEELPAEKITQIFKPWLDTEEKNLLPENSGLLRVLLFFLGMPFKFDTFDFAFRLNKAFAKFLRTGTAARLVISRGRLNRGGFN